jgi:hypothetical protein
MLRPLGAGGNLHLAQARPCAAAPFITVSKSEGAVQCAESIRLWVIRANGWDLCTPACPSQIMR